MQGSPVLRQIHLLKVKWDLQTHNGVWHNSESLQSVSICKIISSKATIQQFLCTDCFYCFFQQQFCNNSGLSWIYLSQNIAKVHQEISDIIERGNATNKGITNCLKVFIYFICCIPTECWQLHFNHMDKSKSLTLSAQRCAWYIKIGV